MRLHQVQDRQAQVWGPRGYLACTGRRCSVQGPGASGALSAAQTLCLNSASLRRGVWRLTRLLLKLLPLRRLRGGLALRRLWMPLRLRERLRMTIESRARCLCIKETLICRYRHIQTSIQANTGKYELREKCICACMWWYKSWNVLIFVWMQANTGSDHENVHIFLTIQANTGKYELPNHCIYACMCMHVTCIYQTYRHIWIANRRGYIQI